MYEAKEEENIPPKLIDSSYIYDNEALQLSNKSKWKDIETYRTKRLRQGDALGWYG